MTLNTTAIGTTCDPHKHEAVTWCIACGASPATWFVAVTLEIVAGYRVRVRKLQMPLCDKCAASVNSIDSRHMAKALARSR